MNVVDARGLFRRRREVPPRFFRLGGLLPSDVAIADLRAVAAAIVARSRGDGPTRIRKAARLLGARDSALAASLVLEELLLQEIGARRGAR
jgi:hypothetical protein